MAHKKLSLVCVGEGDELIGCGLESGELDATDRGEEEKEKLSFLNTTSKLISNEHNQSHFHSNSTYVGATDYENEVLAIKAALSENLVHIGGAMSINI